jgi:hypothetical protein
VQPSTAARISQKALPKGPLSRRLEVRPIATLIDQTASRVVAELFACKSCSVGKARYGMTGRSAVHVQFKLWPLESEVNVILNFLRPSTKLTMLFAFKYGTLGRPVLHRCMSTARVPLVLSPSGLLKLAATREVTFLNASWHMPNSSRNAEKEFLEKRLPGARFFDLDKVASEHELGLKHMMPSGEVLSKAFRMQIVIYICLSIFIIL